MRSNKITFTIGPTTIGHYYKIHTRRKFAHYVRILFFETFLGRLYVMQYMKFEPNEAWVAQILIEPFQRFTQKTVFELVFYSYIYIFSTLLAPYRLHTMPRDIYFMIQIYQRVLNIQYYCRKNVGERIMVHTNFGNWWIIKVFFFDRWNF